MFLSRAVSCCLMRLTSDICHYTTGWIRSLRHRGLRRLHEDDDARLIAPALRDKVRRVLSDLDAADSPQALDLPGYRLHPLKGS
jgi:plasmid maintenance system killer protein